MVRKLISAAVTVLIGGVLYAQQKTVGEAKITWSEESVHDKVYDFSELLGNYNNNNFLIFRNRLSDIVSTIKQENTAVLGIYNSEYKLISTNDLIVNYKGNLLGYYSTLNLKDNFYLFAKYFDKKENVNYILSNKISKEKAALEGEPKILFEVEGAKSSFSHAISFDKSKLAFYYDISEPKTENETVYFKALDYALNELWQNKITFPYSSEQFSVEKYVLDNIGNVHMICKITKPKGERKKEESNYMYKLISYYYQTKELKEYDINVGDGDVMDSQLTTDNNNNVFATGFYTGSDYNIAGIYLTKINSDSKVLLYQTVNKIDEEFKTKFIDSRAPRGKIVNDLNMQDLFIDAEGKLTIVGEQSLSFSFMKQFNGSYNTASINHYNHVFVLRFNTQGELSKWNVIRKSQYTSSYSDFVSYTCSKRGDDIFVLYNDNEEDVEFVDPPKLHDLSHNNFKKAVPVIVKISSDGKMEKITVGKTLESFDNTQFRPFTFFRPTTTNELFAVVYAKLTYADNYKTNFKYRYQVCRITF